MSLRIHVMFSAFGSAVLGVLIVYVFLEPTDNNALNLAIMNSYSSALLATGVVFVGTLLFGGGEGITALPVSLAFAALMGTFAGGIGGATLGWCGGDVEVAFVWILISFVAIGLLLAITTVIMQSLTDEGLDLGGFFSIHFLFLSAGGGMGLLTAKFGLYFHHFEKDVLDWGYSGWAIGVLFGSLLGGLSWIVLRNHLFSLCVSCSFTCGLLGLVLSLLLTRIRPEIVLLSSPAGGILLYYPCLLLADWVGKWAE